MKSLSKRSVLFLECLFLYRGGVSYIFVYFAISYLKLYILCEIIKYTYEGVTKNSFKIKSDQFGFTTIGTFPLKDIQTDAAKVALILVVVGIIAVFLLSAVIIILFVRLVISPLKVAVEKLHTIFNGDLTVQIYKKDRDEIGTLFDLMKNMVEKLNKTVGDISTISNSVVSGSQQISSTTDELSQGANEQAASAEEVSASMEEMASNIEQNAENSKSTDLIANRVAADAQVSGKIVEQAIISMNQIAQKISVIEAIANQTNLLALNAAIEGSCPCRGAWQGFRRCCRGSKKTR